MYLLKSTFKTFDIIAVSETRVSEKMSLTSNANLNNTLLNQLQQNQQ